MMRKIFTFFITFMFFSITRGQVWSEIGGTNSPIFNDRIVCSINDSLGNLYVAGYFTNLTGRQFVSKWNGTIWTNLIGANDSVFNGKIWGLQLDKKGNLYSYGEFANSNGKQYISKWNGVNWSEVGGLNNSTFNGAIYSISFDGLGNLYAGGGFKNSLGKYYLAKWDGINWSEVGGLNTSTYDGNLLSITTDKQNNVYVTGDNVNSNSSYYISKWDGIAWSVLNSNPAFIFNGLIRFITSDKLGNIYAAGRFVNNFNSTYVAKWDGAKWSEVGGKDSSLFNHYIYNILVDTSGNLFISGNFFNESNYCYVSKFNGTKWTEIGGKNNTKFNDKIRATSIDDKGNIYVGGDFTNSLSNKYMAKFDGFTWSEIGKDTNTKLKSVTSIESMVMDNTKKIYFYGSRPKSSNVEYFVNCFNGYTWNELGGINAPRKVSTLFNSNHQISIDDSDYLYVPIGYISLVPSTNPYIGKYKNNNWFNINDSNIDLSEAYPQILDKSGDLYISGSLKPILVNGLNSGLLKYSNGVFSRIGYPNSNYGFNGDLGTLKKDNSGNIYAIGRFKNANNKFYVAKFDGNIWSEIGGTNSSKFDYLSNLLVTPNGNVYVKVSDYSNFPPNYYLARWSNNKWDTIQTEFSNLIVHDMILDPYNNLIARASYIDTNLSGVKYENFTMLVKWNGNKWEFLNSIFNPPMVQNGDYSPSVQNLIADSSGNIYISGTFFNAAGNACVLKYSGAVLYNNVTGSIKTPRKRNIKRVIINLTGANSNSTPNDTLSNFGFKLANGNYTLRPTKNNDITKSNGVNASDVLFVQRHILGTNKLNNAYKIIAADVDGNKLINATDVLRIKRLILGTDTTFKNVLTNELRTWAFVDSAYQFPDTTNPFPFKDSISFTNLTSNKTNQTFIGVKLGDVNFDWNPAIAKGKPVNSLELIVNSENVKDNNQQLTFTSTNFNNIAAMQTTIHFDNTKYEFVSVNKAKLDVDFNASKANETGNIALLWTDKNAEAKTINKDEVLFTLILKPKGIRSEEQGISVNEEMTGNIAIDQSMNERKIILKQLEAKNGKPVERNQIILYPNPTKGNVTIETIGVKEIQIIDMMGRTITQLNKITQRQTLNTKQFGKGIYIVKAIMADGTVRNEKLVVE